MSVGNVAEMNARDRQRAAAVERLQRGQHQVADRSEQNGRVEFHRRPLVGALGRSRAERECQFAGVRIAGHHVHLGATGQRDLGGDVRAAAEAVYPQPAPGG